MTVPGCYAGTDLRYGYVRIGINYVTRRSKSVNFCDLHFWGVILRTAQFQGEFSGPKNSVSQNKAGKRSNWEDHEYIEWGVVHGDNRLENGGLAKIVSDSQAKVDDCWLLGPLRFEGAAYGSLVVRCKYLPFPRLVPKPGAGTGSRNSKDDYSLVVPRGMVGRQGPCTLWGSLYTGTDQSTVNMLPDLSKMKKHVFPVPMPRSAVQFNWKIEAYSDKLTHCDVYEQRG